MMLQSKLWDNILRISVSKGVFFLPISYTKHDIIKDAIHQKPKESKIVWMIVGKKKKKIEFSSTCDRKVINKNTLALVSSLTLGKYYLLS